MEQSFQRWVSNTADLKIDHIETDGGVIRLYYLSTMTDQKVIYQYLIPRLQGMNVSTITMLEIEREIGVSEQQRIFDENQIIESLLSGGAYIHLEQAEYGIYFPVKDTASRQVSPPENETNILGPQNSFVESLEINLALIRKYIRSPRLFHEHMIVGETAPNDIALVYMDGITDEENVQTVRQRINNLMVDSVIDASMLVQYIKDKEYCVFPQLVLTERPDRTVAGLLQGQVVVFVQGSPLAILGPVTFIQLFQATEDSYFRWSISTFLRLLRFLAMFLALLLTPAYVAALTYHYEIIPADLLISLAQSRSRVPFPPLFEAIMLEGIIELLREAGARLPTKIGQTIGIVGGIVIGQAIVQAGFTSNILIIIVALGALSSFSSPNYILGAVIRVLRFPIILLAGLWGGFGIAVGICFLLTHLLRQTSLGRPYLHPVYPLRFADLKDSFIRAPIQFFGMRPQLYRPKDDYRFSPRKAKQLDDIDE
ncbi:spore germination protein [Brevibacillus fluminis]|uniref:Spore germination protein n=1 Tax=Brevibacillus fluminis TaxID=511487 RepID=A0A3M8D9H9_9BACL|nr:spore germination protein [Brevibacillus fluminis]RNB84704.1 spore germination protein [Brevibacillus fluminis]